MKTALLIVPLFFSIFSFSQKPLDSKIIITLPDSTDLYQKTKTAMVRNNFVVKDIPTRDTLATYIREYRNMYTAALAVIKGNTVTISGIYNLKKVDDFGYNRPDKYRKRILYMKGSMNWELLMKIASMIGGEISYVQ